MFAATAVTVQLVAPGRSESGLSVIELEPEPLTANVCAPPQLIVNELVVTSTASLKLTVTSVAGSTSGASTVSTSLIWFAITFTEQTVPSGRLLVGSSVIAEPGEPLTVKVSGVPVGHSSENELVVAVTASLKLTTMFVFTATWSAASAGDVVVTVGAASAVAKVKLVFAAG